MVRSCWYLFVMEKVAMYLNGRGVKNTQHLLYKRQRFSCKDERQITLSGSALNGFGRGAANNGAEQVRDCMLIMRKHLLLCGRKHCLPVSATSFFFPIAVTLPVTKMSRMQKSVNIG